MRTTSFVSGSFGLVGASLVFACALGMVGCGGSAADEAPPAGDDGADASVLDAVAEASPDVATDPVVEPSVDEGVDTGLEASVDPDASPTAVACFAPITPPGALVYINYDQFAPHINSTCTGTNHQAIEGVEKLVFLGDSITAGTPPTPVNQYYRVMLTEMLKQRFGASLEVADCSVWGAQNGDLLAGQNQIAKCFPGVENKKTLVVMTDGGNDIASWAKNKLPATESLPKADVVIGQLRQAIEWLKAPAHFPNGSYVVFSNVYEFTDMTTDMNGCLTGALAGFSGTWTAGAAPLVHLAEQYMKIAVETQTDMIFLEETFCGHGFHANDTKSQCYRGAGSTTWFDLTCIHPTPEGHQHLADLFFNTIVE